jgi:hypothetical protein
LGGGPGPRALPHGKEASPERGVGIRGAWSPEGRAKAKRVHGGRGLPAGIPEAQPAAPGLMGG